MSIFVVAGVFVLFFVLVDVLDAVDVIVEVVLYVVVELFFLFFVLFFVVGIVGVVEVLVVVERLVIVCPAFLFGKLVERDLFEVFFRAIGVVDVVDVLVVIGFVRVFLRAIGAYLFARFEIVDVLPLRLRGGWRRLSSTPPCRRRNIPLLRGSN